jgi:hypothetical protein
MRSRWNANHLLLAALLVVLALVGVDVGRRLVASPSLPADVDATAAEMMRDPTPKFKVGDPAPDAMLDDARKVKHSLLSLVEGDTVITFSCGCNRCRSMQEFLAKKVFPKLETPPKVISINTPGREAAEAAWRRDTGLKQAFLYGNHRSPELMPYKGDPCPRVFRVNADRTVRFIGLSPTPESPVEDAMAQVAREFGVKAEPLRQEVPVTPSSAIQPGNPLLIPQETRPRPTPPRRTPGHDDGHGH